MAPWDFLMFILFAMIDFKFFWTPSGPVDEPGGREEQKIPNAFDHNVPDNSNAYDDAAA
jgi:hypothetical protein